jgi:hypothetical protein
MLTYKRVRLIIISRREYVALIIFEVIGEIKCVKWYEEVNVKST